MKIRRLIIAAILPAAAILSHAAGSKKLPLCDLTVSKDNESVNVSFTIDPEDWVIDSDNRVTVTPRIISANGRDSISLPPFTMAGRNAWYSIIRNEGADSFSGLMRAGKGNATPYAASVPFEGWMMNSKLDFEKTIVCCCDGKPTGAPEEIAGAEMDWRPRKLKPAFHYVAPPVDSVKIFHHSGRADVSYRVNSTKLSPDYMNNRIELEKILKSIRTVGDDRDVTGYHIVLTSYASPEGSFANNLRLAKGRTEAVRDYIFSIYPLDPAKIATSWVAEDWEGLRAWVDSSHIDNRARILQLIDSDLAPDAKDLEIRKKFPDQYAYLLSNVYPTLRHTDYEIRYTVRKYADVEEIRHIMAESPGKLSLNELFIGATSYPEGSPEYLAAFELAASLYPQSETANLNAGMAALECGDTGKAEKYIKMAGESAEADYARGVLLALGKEYTKALEQLQKAQRKGSGIARETADEVEAVMNFKGNVVYLLNETREQQ